MNFNSDDLKILRDNCRACGYEYTYIREVNYVHVCHDCQCEIEHYEGIIKELKEEIKQLKLK